MKKVFGITGLILLLIVVYLAITVGPGLRRFLTLNVQPVDANMTFLLGHGSNSLVLKSDDGGEVLIVDTKMAGGSKKLQKYVDTFAPNARAHIVNTHSHGDHTQGNSLFPNAEVISGDYEESLWKKQSGMKRPPDVRIPVGGEHRLAIGRDTVLVRNVGRAHTYNDVVVYIPTRKLLMTGDVIFNHLHPALFRDEGSHVGSWLVVLSILKEWNVETVAPGHGAVTDRTGIDEMIHYFQDMREAGLHPDQKESILRRHRDYDDLPLMTSAKKTMRFIAEEGS